MEDDPSESSHATRCNALVTAVGPIALGSPRCGRGRRVRALARTVDDVPHAALTVAFRISRLRIGSEKVERFIVQRPLPGTVVARDHANVGGSKFSFLHQERRPRCGTAAIAVALVRRILVESVKRAANECRGKSR